MDVLGRTRCPARESYRTIALHKVFTLDMTNPPTLFLLKLSKLHLYNHEFLPLKYYIYFVF